MKSLEVDKNKERICPYLGLAGDPFTVYSNPSYLNRCHSGKRSTSLSPEHQNTFCLNSNYINCDVYKAKLVSNPQVGSKGYEQEETHSANADSSPKKILLIITLCSALFVLALMLAWLDHSQRLQQLPMMGFATLTSNSALMAGTTPTLAIQSTPTMASPTLIKQPPTATVTPLSPTLSPTVPAFRVLETPIGRTTQLIIHQVRPGESLDLISQNYATTVDAIQAINYFIPSPLLINALVVVPFNRTDVTGLPPFEAIQVQSDISVESLAQDLDVDVSLLKLYNQLNEGEMLKKGDWVLVPRTK